MFLANWNIFFCSKSKETLATAFDGLWHFRAIACWLPYSISKQLHLYLNQGDPYLTFDPNNALHSGQGLFLPNLVAFIRVFLLAIWFVVDPGWRLNDIGPHRCIKTPASVFPPTKFWQPYGISEQLDPLVTPNDFYVTFDPAMHYTSLRGSSDQMWWP